MEDKTKHHTFALAKTETRGVAQLVAFLVWDQAVAGSSPVTSTKDIREIWCLLSYIGGNGRVTECFSAASSGLLIMQEDDFEVGQTTFWPIFLAIPLRYCCIWE